jgi:hypothetical protein
LQFCSSKTILARYEKGPEKNPEDHRYYIAGIDCCRFPDPDPVQKTDNYACKKRNQ